MTPDDDIEASKAPLMEHLLELRRRLMWSLLAVFLAFLVCFWFARPIYNLLLWPYRLAVGSDVPIDMIYTAPQEFFFTQVKLAIFGAIFIAFPVIASQIYMFVAPGLYRNERKAFLPYPGRHADPVPARRRAGLFRRHAARHEVLPVDAADRRHAGADPPDGQGERISLADHDADPRLRHLLPTAGAADAARPRRPDHRRRR